MATCPVLIIVIPCYNEEAVLPETVPMFKQQLENMILQGLVSSESRIMFVNDGSKDSTWDLITRYAQDNDKITGISLSRNRGHQNALLAGLMEAKDHCDITISIDADGQDDISAMTDMVKAYWGGQKLFMESALREKKIVS